MTIRRPPILSAGVAACMAKPARIGHLAEASGSRPCQLTVCDYAGIGRSRSSISDLTDPGDVDLRLTKRLSDGVHDDADSLSHPPRRRCPVATRDCEDAAYSGDASREAERGSLGVKSEDTEE